MAKKAETEKSTTSQPKKDGLFKQILKGLGIEGVADIGVMAAIVVGIIKLSPLAKHIPQNPSAGGHAPVKGSGLTSRMDETHYAQLTEELERIDPSARPILHQIYWAIPPVINPSDYWPIRVRDAIIQMVHQSRYRTEIVNMSMETIEETVRNPDGSVMLDTNGKPRTASLKINHGLEFIKLLVKIAKSEGIPAVIGHLQSCNIIPSGKISEELASVLDSGANLIKASATSEWTKSADKTANTGFLWLGRVVVLMIAILISATVYVWDPIDPTAKNAVVIISCTTTLLLLAFIIRKRVTNWLTKIRGDVQ